MAGRGAAGESVKGGFPPFTRWWLRIRTGCLWQEFGFRREAPGGSGAVRLAHPARPMGVRHATASRPARGSRSSSVAGKTSVAPEPQDRARRSGGKCERGVSPRSRDGGSESELAACGRSSDSGAKRRAVRERCVSLIPLAPWELDTLRHHAPLEGLDPHLWPEKRLLRPSLRIGRGAAGESVKGGFPPFTRWWLRIRTGCLWQEFGFRREAPGGSGAVRLAHPARPMGVRHATASRPAPEPLSSELTKYHSYLIVASN